MRAINAIVIGLVALIAVPAHAAQIVIINADQPGLGLNDPTPVAPVPGNPGTTLGQQRMNVIVEAATRWGRTLVSDVPIRLRVSFEDMQCEPSWTWFGFAGPAWLNYDFTNAPLPGTWYPSALASALRGIDMAGPESPHIQVRLNPLLDTGCMGAGTGWWYALEPTAVPNGRIVMLTVAMHELAHGLGVLTQVGQGGEQAQGRPDVWNHSSFDLEQNRLWPEMTDAQRAQSAINDPDLVWVGDRTNEQQARYLRRPARLSVTAPAAIAGNYAAASSGFGQAVPPAGIAGQIAAALPGEACTPLSNPAAIAGRIALVDRGTCLFQEKVRNAQAAGAIAVVIADNADNPGLVFAFGIDPEARLPSCSVSLATGNAIRAQLAAGVQARLTYDSAAPYLGTREGNLRLSAPNPYVSGSSVSHISQAAYPTPLMTPAIPRSNFGELDLTPALLRDMGWPIDPLFGDGFGGRFE